MAKLQNTFEFVGNIKFMKEPVKTTVFDSGWTKKELKAIIKENEANGGFITLEGGFYKEDGKPKTVYSFSKSKFGESGGKLQIAWEDRLKPEIVNNVANFSKIVIDFTKDEEVKKKLHDLRGKIYNIESNENATDEDKKKLVELYDELVKEVPARKEFLHELDAIDYLNSLHERLEGQRLKVKGEVTPSYWKGDVRVNYTVKTIELASEEDVNGLKLDLDLYFNSNVINDILFEEKKLYTYDTFILSYDGQAKKEQFFPLKTVLDASKYDLSNPKHQGHINIVNKFFTLEDEEMVYQLPYTAKLISGSEVVPFSENDLTEDQKQLIEFGLATLDDFKPSGGNVFGDKVEQIRLLVPKIKNLGDKLDFTKGAKVTLVKAEDLKYNPKEESEYQKPKENKVDNSDPFEISEDDLPF